MPYGEGTWKLAHEGVGSVERGHTALNGLTGGLGPAPPIQGQMGGLDVAQRHSTAITLICPECGLETKYSRADILAGGGLSDD